jgi:hypothetical protein
MLSEDRHIISRAAEQQAAAQPQCQWAGQRHGGVAFPWEWSSGLDIWTLASERAYGWRLAGGPVRRCCASTRECVFSSRFFFLGYYSTFVYIYPLVFNHGLIRVQKIRLVVFYQTV